MSTSEEYKSPIEAAKEAWNFVSPYAKKAGRGMKKAYEKSLDLAEGINSHIPTKKILINGGIALATTAASAYLADKAGLDDPYVTSIGLGTTAALYAGLGVQYLRGKFPFIRIDQPIYHPLQWFTKSKGRILEGPGTRLYLPPLERIVTEEANGEERQVMIPKRAREANTPSFQFRTVDNLEGTINAQYTFSVPTKKDAKKLYWTLEGKNKDIITTMEGVIDGAVVSALQDVICTINEMGPDPRRVSRGISYSDEVFEILNDPDKKSKSLYSKWGIRTETMRTFEPNYDERSETILAKVKDAEEEKKAAIIVSETTQIITKKYLDVAMDTARGILGSAATEEEVGKLAYQILERDKDRDQYERVIAASGGRASINILQGAIPITPVK